MKKSIKKVLFSALFVFVLFRSGDLVAMKNSSPSPLPVVPVVNDIGNDGKVEFNNLKLAVEKGDLEAIRLFLEDEDALSALEIYSNAYNSPKDNDNTENFEAVYDLLCLAKEKQYRNVVDALIESCDCSMYFLICESIEQEHEDMFDFFMTRVDVKKVVSKFLRKNHDVAIMLLERAVEYLNLKAVRFFLGIRGVDYTLEELVETLESIEQETQEILENDSETAKESIEQEAQEILENDSETAKTEEIKVMIQAKIKEIEEKEKNEIKVD